MVGFFTWLLGSHASRCCAHQHYRGLRSTQDKSFTLYFNVTMLLPPTHMALHSPRLLSLTRRAFSSSPSSFQGGVSMVQGASRGIGLEFVRFFSYLHINIAYLGTAHIVKIFKLYMISNHFFTLLLLSFF